MVICCTYDSHYVDPGGFVSGDCGGESSCTLDFMKKYLTDLVGDKMFPCPPKSQ